MTAIKAERQAVWSQRGPVIIKGMDEKGWEVKIGTTYDTPKHPQGFLQFFKRLQSESKGKLNTQERPQLQQKIRQQQTPLRLPRNQLQLPTLSPRSSRTLQLLEEDNRAKRQQILHKVHDKMNKYLNKSINLSPKNSQTPTPTLTQEQESPHYFKFKGFDRLGKSMLSRYELEDIKESSLLGSRNRRRKRQAERQKKFIFRYQEKQVAGRVAQRYIENYQRERLSQQRYSIS